jgi:outer membrane protein assembly factor BamE (lipoprotein component of BamABCDE complex)
LLIAALAPIASACTLGRLRVGDPLSTDAVTRLYSGQAKTEVLERLGPPDRVTTLRNESAFEYFYRENLDRELDISVLQSNFDYEQIWLRADRLVVRFDAKGEVRDYGVNLQTGRSE